VFCVYLGNAICDLERSLTSFEKLDRTVLRDLGIETEAQLMEVASKLRTGYEEAAGDLPRR
jgi:hypothetical protein